MSMASPSLPAAILGAWRLCRAEFKRSDGTVFHPYGLKPDGMIFYGADGSMAAQVMPGDENETGSTGQGYIAYFGTYEVETEQGCVRHQVLGSLNPGWIGTIQVRHVAVEGDQLEIRTAPMMLDGHETVGQLIWRRTGGSVGRGKGA
jgi:hypothetical protein